MFTEVLDALDTFLYVDDMLQRFPSCTFSWILDQPTLPIQWSPFLNGYSPYKALASATSTLVCISKIAKHKVTLVKELYLSGYSSPRFRVFQIYMRRRSEEDFSFKSFKKQETCWWLYFAYYCFPFSNVRNLLCWLMCTYSFVSSQVSRICF